MKDNVPRGPNGKTISIAAPSSFWYLKNFPIKEMAKHIDYIVYMTYDLHGEQISRRIVHHDFASNRHCAL